ncbi:MAG TPA: regulatory protein RecX [Terriglobales bacterium]|nr:regulatory protein RecX [Terriglobales bacterium]
MRQPKKLADEDVLYDYAVKALGRRMRSVAELKRLLRQRAAPGSEAVIERVVARLKEYKYLNDSAYAAAYSSYRKENEKFGPRRVISDLKARGVHGDVVRKAVADAFAGTDEEQHAREFLRRKRIARPADDRGAARIFRTLMRAGFSTRAALRVLNKWNVDSEVLSALESEGE